MLEISLILLWTFIFGSLIEKKFKIPLSITVLSLALISNLTDHKIFNVSEKEFDYILLGLLPLFITVDAFALKIKDLATNSISLLYTAFISIVLSIGLAIAIDGLIFPDYDIPAPALAMLFCMVLATDPITVTSVFGNFKLPHKLKIIAEGESLFNDAFALIIFFVALGIYKDGSVDYGNIALYSINVLIFSILIGMLFGAISLYLLQLTDDAIIETAIILGCAYGAFLLAEHFHYAGILSIIVCVIFAKSFIDKRIERYEKDAKNNKSFIRLTKDLVNIENQKMIKKFIVFASSLAGIVLFVVMGEVMNIEIMLKYWKEILAVFVATTIIRAIMMTKFAIISNKIIKMKNISFHWWQVLTFSGVKGGLSILMVHLIPADFEYKVLFEAIVFGNIILTTFVYSLVLSLIIFYHKNKFDKEYNEEILEKH